MKRDMELIKKILLQLEEKPDLKAEELPAIEGYGGLVINYHLMLLAEEEFITAGSPPFVYGLTWKGHEFLDELRRRKFDPAYQHYRGTP